MKRELRTFFSARFSVSLRLLELFHDPGRQFVPYAVLFVNDDVSSGMGELPAVHVVASPGEDHCPGGMVPRRWISRRLVSGVGTVMMTSRARRIPACSRISLCAASPSAP